MAKCTAITRGGERCKRIAIDSSGYSYAHHPDHEQDRHQAARKGGKRGGRGRPQAELAAIKQRLSGLAHDVLEGAVDKGVAAVASQVLNVYLRALSVELRVNEQLEIIERLESLEESLQANAAQNNGGNRWRGT